MSTIARLLGISGSRATAAPVAASRPPTAATLPIGWSNGKNPQTAEWDAAAATDIGYYGYVYHYGCARTLATTIAGLPWRMGPDPKSPGVFNVNHPLARLLGPPPGGPAPGITPRQLLTHSIVSYLITGRFAWETPTPAGQSNVPGALWPLITSKLKPIPTDSGLSFFSSYEYDRAAGKQPLNLNQVFYAWRPSQKDWRQPESAMQSMALPTRIAISLNQYMASFMDQNMVGSKLVITPGWDDTEQQRAFEDQFLSEMTGVRNAGRVAFGQYESDDPEDKTPAIQVVDMGTKPVDAQVIEMLNWCRDTICDGWHVPISILGQAAERTYANADQEHKNYWTGAVLNLIYELQDLINVGLAPRFGDDVGWFDLSGVEALKPNSRFAQMPANVALAAEVVTIGEVREDMSYPPSKPTDPNSPPAPNPVPSIDDTPGIEGGAATGTNPASGAAAAADGQTPEGKHVHDFRAGICTGPGPCDTSPTGTGKNWVTEVGGLPAYIRAIVHALKSSGHSETEAVQIAIATVKRWAAGGGDVTPKTQATATAALAEWEAKKAASHRAVLETSSAGTLLPVGPTKPLTPHLPIASETRGICAQCRKPVSDPIHLKARPSTRSVRHAGPAGHAHVVTGHHAGARRRTMKQVHAQADALEPAVESTMKDLFAQQRKATVDRLNGRRGQQMLRAAAEGGAGDGIEPASPANSESPAPIVDAAQVFDWAHWVAKTQDALKPTYAVIGGVAKTQLAKFGDSVGASQGVADALAARSTALASTVSRTTYDQIVQVLQQGIANGDSISQLTNAVNDVFDNADSARAQMIARTEVIGALNTAADARASALGSGVVAGKEWIATHDDRTRPMHREADGQVTGMGLPFMVGGYGMQHPGDPSAPPDEVINCRCTTGYLTPAEYAKRSGLQLPAPSTAPPIAA